jgi:Tfp pilus assembly protein PilX
MTSEYCATSHRQTGPIGAARQQGVVLFIALIALVAMTLAGIALVRSVDTSTLIAGNLAFKQNSTALADLGVEAGRTWLIANANTATLNDDSPAQGYYATSQDSLDLTGTITPNNLLDDVNWDGTNSSAASQAAILPDSSLPAALRGTSTVSFIIHRLCASNGVLTSAQCATSQQSSSSGSTKGGGGVKAISGVLQGHYRVTTRVMGPRNTISYVQTIIRL